MCVCVREREREYILIHPEEVSMKTAWNPREYKSRFKVMAICEGKRHAIVLVVVTWRFYVYMTHLHLLNDGRLCGLTGSVLDHRSLPPVFESRRGDIWRVFHLWLRFITLGGRSAHLAYHVHKNGRKIAIIILSKDYQKHMYEWNSNSQIVGVELTTLL